MREVVVAGFIFWAEGDGRQDIWPVQGVSRARRATVEPQLKIGLGRGLSLGMLFTTTKSRILFLHLHRADLLHHTMLQAPVPFHTKSYLSSAQIVNTHCWASGFEGPFHSQEDLEISAGYISCLIPESSSLYCR